MRGNQVKLLGNITSLSSFIWAVLLLGVMLGLTPKAGAVPTLDWTVTYSRTVGGDDRYRASYTDASGNTYFVYQDSYGEARLVKYDAAGLLLSDAVLEVQDPLITLTAMTVDSTGNVFIAGTIFSLVTFRNDLCVAKFDAAGNLLWPAPMVYDTGFFDTTYGVATDGSGNVIISGTFDALFDKDIIVLKYDTSGVLQWDRILTGPTDDEGYAVTADGADNVYVVGTYGFPGPAFSYFAKYDSAGFWQFTKSYGGPGMVYARAATYEASSDSVYLAADDLANVAVLQVAAADGTLTNSGLYADPTRQNITGGITVDAGGNVFVALTTIDLPTSGATYDAKIIHFDPALSPGWEDTYDAGDMDGFDYPIASTRVGMFGSTVFLSSYLTPPSCFGPQDLWVRKYNGTGTAQWTQVFDGAPVAGVTDDVTDLAGDVYVAGVTGSNPLLLKFNDKNGNLRWARDLTFSSGCGLSTEGLAQFGDNILVAASVLNLATFFREVEVVKVLPDGTQVPGPGFKFDSIPDSDAGPITLDDNGNLYLAGRFENTATFEDDLFVVKYDWLLRSIQWTTTLTFAADDRPTGIALDGAGDLYVLESTPNDGVTDDKFGLIKLDSGSGAVLWTRTYSANPALSGGGLALQGSGADIYLAGYDFDPLSGALWGRLYRIDALGNVVWTRSYNGGQDAAFLDLVVDQLGNPFVSGQIGTALTNTYDVLTLAYYANGDERWVETFDSGSPDEAGRGLAMGSLYVAGLTGRDVRVLKYSEPAIFSVLDITVIPATVKQCDNVTVVMEVGNIGGTRAWTLLPSVAAGPAPAGMVALVSGPSPASTPWLDPGQSASFTWTYQANATGYVDFTATVTGTGSMSGLPISDFASSTTVYILPAVCLSVTSWVVTSGTSLKAGSTFTFMFTVSNTGAVDASLVLASLNLSDPSLVRIDSGPIPSGTVTIGANSVVTFVWQLTVESWDGGTLTLDASVTGIDLLNSVGLSATAQAVLNTKPKPQGQFVAYPNPIEGPPWRLNIYLRLNDDAREVTVDAYDAAIHRVYSGKWGFVAQVDGALEVDGIDQWATGIYLLRARAELVNGSTQEFPVVKVVVK